MLSRQAKTLTQQQQRALLLHIEQTRNPIRNRAIVMLSVKAGLRAKEIAGLTWSMVTDAEGQIVNVVRLEDRAAKGRTGGVIPMASDLRRTLCALRAQQSSILGSDCVVRTERHPRTTPQVIVNLFASWYRQLGFDGCSSHSGRRTFITNAARNIGRVGGSIRDVQALARHASLSSTQKYIEVDGAAQMKVLELF